MNFKTILLEKKDTIYTLTLNRVEKLNALNKEVCEEVFKALEIIEKDNEARVLVITSKGKCFSAGGDFNTMQEISGDVFKTDELITYFPKVALKLRNLNIPVVAKIQGDAYGGGFCLALACDMRLAVEDAKFGFVFFRVGLSGADFGATYFLTRLVGIAKAFEILSLSKTINSQEAEKIGLINFCVTKEKLEEETEKIIKQLSEAPPFALKMTKKALYFGLDRDIEADFNYECYVQDLCFQTQDHKEGVKAFLEKRKPNFVGG